MNELNSLMNQSINQYRLILQQCREVSQVLKELQPQDIQDYLDRCNATLAATSLIDEALNQKLQKTTAAITTSPLFQERQKLIAQAERENKSICSKLTGRLAVISEDIAQVRNSRTAIAGYHSGGKGKGNILNSSI